MPQQGRDGCYQRGRDSADATSGRDSAEASQQGRDSVDAISGRDSADVIGGGAGDTDATSGDWTDATMQSRSATDWAAVVRDHEGVQALDHGIAADHAAIAAGDTEASIESLMRAAAALRQIAACSPGAAAPSAAS